MNENVTRELRYANLFVCSVRWRHYGRYKTNCRHDVSRHTEN